MDADIADENQILSEDTFNEGRRSASIASTSGDVESQELAEVDEAFSVSDFLSPEMQQVAEFQEILRMIGELPHEDRPTLYDVPEISDLFDAAAKRVQQQFTPKVVLMELHNIYQVLAVSRSNENSLKKRLTTKEQELTSVYEKLRRDPRVHKALVLAESWRQQRDKERNISKEYQAVMDNLKTDMKDLEMKIHNLQTTNTRAAKNLEKIPRLEDSIRSLEEVLLKKENFVTFLLSEVERYKQQFGDDTLAGCERLKELYAKALAETESYLPLKEMEKNYKRDVATLKSEHRKQMAALKAELEMARLAEINASNNYKKILKSIRSMKKQLQTLESHSMMWERKTSRMAQERDQCKGRMAEMEEQFRAMRQREEAIEQSMTQIKLQNEQLKSELGSVASTGRIFLDHARLKKALREKEKEVATCVKEEGRLEQDLKFTNLQLRESKRLQETQQRVMNNAKEEIALGRQDLAEAIRYSDAMFRRLEWTETYLKYYKKKFGSCKSDNVDISNTLKHLEALCKEHEATIRVKDAKNDSLVLGLTNLEELLRDAHVSIHNLRQANLLAQTNHLHQMELNDMMTQLLRFTEAEKVAAVNECNKNVDTVLLLQKQLVQRMARIASQYKDICDLKATIEKHLQMLEIQKKETNAVRDLLAIVRADDNAQKQKLKAVTQERDVFGAVLIERNTIIQLQEKKIHLLEGLLERGAVSYNSRMDDIRLLKLEIKNLRHKLASREKTEEISFELNDHPGSLRLSDRSTQQLADINSNVLKPVSVHFNSSSLRDTADVQDLVRACRELQLERHKRKAIEEFKTPKPHRYVDLKGRDPSQYEQVLKIQKLQRLLIVKYDQLTKLEEALVSGKLHIQQLEILLTRRYGDDTLKQLHEAKILITQKNKQIKLADPISRFANKAQKHDGCVEEFSTPTEVFANKQIRRLLSEANILNFDFNERGKQLNKALKELKVAKGVVAKQKRQLTEPLSKSEADKTKATTTNVGLSVVFTRTHHKLQQPVFAANYPRHGPSKTEAKRVNEV